MAAVRTRLTLDDDPVRQYALFEPAIKLDPGRSYSARDVQCEDCGAAEGEACSGSRFCASRMSATAALARAGELESSAIAIVQPCRRCGEYGGRVLACPEHRCGHGSCKNRRGHDSQHCGVHASGANRGRRSGRSPETLQAINKRREAGERLADVCRDFGISSATYYQWSKAS